MIDKTLSFTRRSLAEALDNVRHLSDLGPEMIAEQVFAASAQQPALTVPEGWKLVPVDPTEEILDAICLAKNMTRRGLAVVMNMQELESIYRAMLAAAPAAPVAQEPVAIEVMQFQLKHPDSGETHTVELTRGEVADGMEDTLYEKLSPMVCQCNGDADHECGDYIHDFDLVADPPAAEQPDTVAVPRELLERLAGSPDLDPDCCAAYYRQQLRALLAGGEA
jgi:hypothetical protein